MTKYEILDSVPFGKTIEEHRIYYKWWRTRNKEDYNKKRLEWANKNRKKRTIQARNSYLKKKYNISNEEYYSLYNKQNGKCAICFQCIEIILNKRGNNSNSCHLDHDHKTGKIRGMLCHSCNNALGHFKDNTKIMLQAVKYITNYIDDKGLSDKDFFK